MIFPWYAVLIWKRERRAAETAAQTCGKHKPKEKYVKTKVGGKDHEKR